MDKQNILYIDRLIIWENTNITSVFLVSTDAHVGVHISVNSQLKMSYTNLRKPDHRTPAKKQKRLYCKDIYYLSILTETLILPR